MARLTIVWESTPLQGTVEVFHGKLNSPSSFRIEAQTSPRLHLELSDVNTNEGAFQTRVTVRTDQAAFTFLVRDVLASGTLFIPMYNVAVTTGQDRRTYQQIAKDIKSQELLSDWQRMQQAPEETYQEACRHNRNMECQTWLGLSRDVRIFQMNTTDNTGYGGWIRPMYHSKHKTVPRTASLMQVNFELGRGAACRTSNKRYLDQGVLPIFHSEMVEAGITYNLTAFASYETQPVTAENHRGTDWTAAYANVNGCRLSDDERKEVQELLHNETVGREQELICCVRVEAVNNANTPQYAWFGCGRVRIQHLMPSPAEGETFESGKCILKDSTVYAVNRINRKAMPQPEMAVLIQPGESAVFEIIVPHSPVSQQRAERLLQLDIGKHLEGARAFWNNKLQSAAQISVPEKTINERIRACLLNCDVNTLGLTTEGPLLATVGNYGPIGSESSPMIQFFDSIGWHDAAERSLDFFLDLQREDGFIQTYDHYELETGPVLWSMGEHYRYTQDKQWLERVTPRLIKACDYLLNWRNRNKKEDLRGKGYGMIDGRVADPEDYFHAFMLNALAYAGLSRSVEMLEETAPDYSKRLAMEVKEYKDDIRDSLFEAIACSPVIPFGDGSWIPTVPSWPGYPGAMALYADAGEWWTHAMFGARDSLCGPLYLLLGEVVDPNELAGEIILKYNQKLFTIENAGLSQPYYCRHDFGHLKRNEVKLFLKTYYNQLTALADRETYTFWEHYYHASPNKTHETGWFLMQTRWMLYMEDGQSLRLLGGIPRKWMEAGKRISLERVATHFGPLSLLVESKLDEGRIRVVVECPSDRKPQSISIRLPHPDNTPARKCTGGEYHPDEEYIVIKNFDGKAEIELEF